MALVRWLPVAMLLFLFMVCKGRYHSDTDVECNNVAEHSARDHLLKSGHEMIQAIDTQAAEHMQKHHLEILFNRYGENGSISIEGLKKLLESIGLDRIKKVPVRDGHFEHEHEDHHQRGHNHHPHHHPHHHHYPYQHKIPASKKGADTLKIIRNNLTASKKTEDSSIHHNLYAKKVIHEISTTPVYTTNILLKSSEMRNRRSVDHPSDAAGLSTTAGTGFAKRDGLETTKHSPVSNLLVPGEHSEPAQVGKDKHMHTDDHDHHEHLEKECFNASRILSSHGMNMEAVLTYVEFSYLCPALLNQIDSKSCIQHTAYLRKPDDHSHDDHEADHTNSDTSQKPNSIEAAWIGGFVSITIISLLSLLGVILIPLMNRVFFKFLLSFLVALAVGTLSGDAFLHLIPHSQGSHNHNHSAHPGNDSDHHHHHHAEGGGKEGDLDSVWKGLTALGGVYFMFLIEHFITLGKMYKDKKQKNQKKWDHTEESLGVDDQQPSKEECQDIKQNNDLEGKIESNMKDQSQFAPQQPPDTPEEEEVMLAPVLSQDGYNEYTAQGCENKCHSHFHDTIGQADDLHHHHHDYHHILHHHHSQNHHPHSHSHHYSREQFKGAGIATLAWMVIMGDGLHNFSDGLAIGAAFTEGISSGLSTSVAVFCHELPHELGDFAVLLKAGMTVKQAILYNMLSAMMAYLGMITGILIGHYAENISMWIFALTAGLFMYVALVDMVPEMLHNDAGDHGFSHCGYFLLQNAGILLGFSIMLVIAIFEDKILLDIKL
ncbi:zinc transporter ZIP6-like isoform X1 [Acipenser ruthenus]|uniref:zinc transporter ZIP6-like isoform X1 n=1 Tax=Acipenser ruthenus TaxID=7906 RepID=UPI0027419C92|nr:zinc transporter ZIP6-like isoform X1 [Acipenser ruthenus]XP_058878585.1 zinc transporter ZIP6-like isoform X1 [Acipenser ruthenus]